MTVAERIYDASTREDQATSRLAEKVARCIEDDIATRNLPAGDGLGSLRDLSRRYAVGMAATREAAVLLERRGLGRLRPGPCGGFIVAVPKARMIGAELADYFRAMGVTRGQLAEAREAIEGLADEPAIQPLIDCLDRLALDFAEAGVLYKWSSERTRAGLIASRLATEIARETSPGQRLGSEWDLCERFGVGRATLRLAIRQLQDSGFVECRRGRGNGLVVRNRRARGCIRLMLAYLIGNRVEVATAGKVLLQINRHTAALAVGKANPEQRRKLCSILAQVEARDPFDRYDLLGLVHFISQLAQSPVVDLVSRSLAAYEARFHPSLRERLPARNQASYFRLIHRLLDKVPVDTSGDLAWAKGESERVMLEMSLSRPI